MSNAESTLSHRAISAFQAGRFIEAASLFRHLTSQNAERPDYHLTLGVIYERLNQQKDALESYRHALHLDLNSREALTHYQRCIELSPGAARAYNRLGIEMAKADKQDLARDCFKRAIELAPKYATAYNNLALLCKTQGRFLEALDLYQQAVAWRPDYAQAQWNLALMLLLTGQFEAGWEKFKWRRLAELDAIMDCQRHMPPTWDGGPFRHQRLLLRTEQGLGDNLQFIRYLPQVKRLGGTVVVETPPSLIELFSQIREIDTLIISDSESQSPCRYDLVAYIMDLPALLKTTLKTLPADVPYLYADIVKVKDWRTRLITPKLKVGIVWAGSQDHANDSNRSCSLEALVPLSKLPNVQLYSLQRGDREQDLIRHDHLPIIDLAPNLHSLADTAAAVDQLDLVISVDTAVLHLAGAMGKPAWALIPFAPDWRWMLDRQDSPWYPTLRLFRQSRPGQWDDVIERVMEHLDRTLL
jgi:Flp pilus assembly protein TadD